MTKPLSPVRRPEPAVRLWKVDEWCSDARISRATFYKLRPAPHAARFGADLRIAESPKEYAARIARVNHGQ
jgi:hypothetical protein